MTRPTILDLDLVVVPREATVEMWREAATPIKRYGVMKCVFPVNYAACLSYRAALSASPYPTAWDDVRKYVEGLERLMVCGMAELAASNPNAMEYAKHWEGRAFAAEARIAELEKEKHAALTLIAMLEKRLADAEKVIEPFFNVAGEMFARNWQDKQIVISLDNPDASHRVTFRDFRAARSYMEGK